MTTSHNPRIVTIIESDPDLSNIILNAVDHCLNSKQKESLHIQSISLNIIEHLYESIHFEFKRYIIELT